MISCVRTKYLPFALSILEKSAWEEMEITFSGSATGFVVGLFFSAAIASVIAFAAAVICSCVTPSPAFKVFPAATASESVFQLSSV